MNGPTSREGGLTGEQRAALDARSVSVALSAGAGCGKTTVLTERYLALLAGPDRRKVEEIVALTFTEKAARELRERVRRLCRERLATGEDAAHWREVLRGLEFARIGTFHAFCGAILREFPIEAGLDPSYEVLDEAIAPSIREEAIATCLRRWLASKNPDLIALAVDHGLGEIRDALASLLADRPDFDLLAWSGRSPERVVASWEESRAGKAAADLFQGLHDDHRGLLELLAAHECSHPVGRERRAYLLAEIPLLAGARDRHAALRDLLERAKVIGGGDKRHWPSAEVYEAVKGGLGKLRDSIKAIVELLEPDDGRSLAAAEAGLRFARLAHEAIEQYADAKRSRGVLDFQDLQSRVRDLLRHGPPHALDRLRMSVGVLLVDEFQDTDPVQAEILDGLAGPDGSSGRLFLVGDVKQSIYGFRGAQPAIFGAYRERFPVAGRLDLTENFRSVPGILAFVNGLFAHAFPGAEHALRPGGPRKEGDPGDGPCVEFLWEGGPQDAIARRKAEASAIARVLANRLADGWRIRDPQGGLREATPGDVALLFRSRSDFPTYEQALANEGLDYHLVGGTAYFSQQEVIDLVNLLSALEDPLDALSLAGTLRGPIFGVSDEGLFWLATAVPGDLATTFASWEEVADKLDRDDRSAVARASELLARWRGLKDRLPIAALLDRCLDESGFEAALLGEFLGDRKRANVRKLVRLARRFDARGGFTLADFVARLRADLRNPPREEQATTTDERGRAVLLMTIHQAKGLEFPIVVVPDLERKAPNASDLVACHPEFGVLVRANSEDEDDERPRWSLGRALRDRMHKRAEDAEALRCLYVATTRAKDRLILSAGRAADEPPKSPAMRLLAERFDLASGAPRADLPAGWPAPRVGMIDAGLVAADGATRRTKFRPKLLLTARRIARAGELPAVEPARAPSRPGFVDLAATSGRNPRTARLARLVRVVLSRGEWLGAGFLPDAIAAAARSRGEWATARDLAEADRVLTACRGLDVWPLFAGAERVLADLPWTLAWPFDDPAATVYRGRIDLAARDASGSWRLLGVSFDEDRGSLRRARLNLLLSAYAADALGIGPVVAGHLVRLLPDGALVERIESFDAATVEDAIREALSGE